MERFGWVSLVVGIWIVFKTADSVAPPAQKSRVTQWLKSPKPGEVVVGWLPTFVEVFDRLFGEKHVSWRCFRRSCIASIGAVLLVTLYWAMSRPREVLAIFVVGHPGNAFANYIAFTLLLSLVPDYASLLKSRGLIGWMSRKPSIRRLCLGVVLDVLCTVILVWLSWYIYFLLHWGLPLGLHGLPIGLTLRMPLWITGAMMFVSYWLSAAPGFFPVGIWPWATLFTSTWAALYAVASALVKLARYVGMGLSGVRWVVDIDSKPIAALGVVAIGLVTAVYVVVGVAHWIVGG